jgi:hypothetical protein
MKFPSGTAVFSLQKNLLSGIASGSKGFRRKIQKLLFYFHDIGGIITAERL